MKAAYCEIKRGRNCVTVNYYSKEGYGLELGCRKRERERREAVAARLRDINPDAELHPVHGLYDAAHRDCFFPEGCR